MDKGDTYIPGTSEDDGSSRETSPNPDQPQQQQQQGAGGDLKSEDQHLHRMGNDDDQKTNKDDNNTTKTEQEAQKTGQIKTNTKVEKERQVGVERQKRIIELNDQIVEVTAQLQKYQQYFLSTENAIKESSPSSEEELEKLEIMAKKLKINKDAYARLEIQMRDLRAQRATLINSRGTQNPVKLEMPPVIGAPSIGLRGLGPRYAAFTPPPGGNPRFTHGQYEQPRYSSAFRPVIPNIQPKEGELSAKMGADKISTNSVEKQKFLDERNAFGAAAKITDLLEKSEKEKLELENANKLAKELILAQSAAAAANAVAAAANASTVEAELALERISVLDQDNVNIAVINPANIQISNTSANRARDPLGDIINITHNGTQLDLNTQNGVPQIGGNANIFQGNNTVIDTVPLLGIPQGLAGLRLDNAVDAVTSNMAAAEAANSQIRQVHTCTESIDPRNTAAAANTRNTQNMTYVVPQTIKNFAAKNASLGANQSSSQIVTGTVQSETVQVGPSRVGGQNIHVSRGDQHKLTDHQLLQHLLQQQQQNQQQQPGIDFTQWNLLQLEKDIIDQKRKLELSDQLIAENKAHASSQNYSQNSFDQTPLHQTAQTKNPPQQQLLEQSSTKNPPGALKETDSAAFTHPDMAIPASQRQSINSAVIANLIGQKLGITKDQFSNQQLTLSENQMNIIEEMLLSTLDNYKSEHSKTKIIDQLINEQATEQEMTLSEGQINILTEMLLNTADNSEQTTVEVEQAHKQMQFSNQQLTLTEEQNNILKQTLLKANIKTPDSKPIKKTHQQYNLFNNKDDNNMESLTNQLINSSMILNKQPKTYAPKAPTVQAMSDALNSYNKTCAAASSATHLNTALQSTLPSSIETVQGIQPQSSLKYKLANPADSTISSLVDEHSHSNTLAHSITESTYSLEYILTQMLVWKSEPSKHLFPSHSPQESVPELVGSTISTYRTQFFDKMQQLENLNTQLTSMTKQILTLNNEEQKMIILESAESVTKQLTVQFVVLKKLENDINRILVHQTKHRSTLPLPMLALEETTTLKAKDLMREVDQCGNVTFPSSTFVQCFKKLTNFGNRNKFTEKMYIQALDILLCGDIYDFYSSIRDKPLSRMLNMLSDRFVKHDSISTYQKSLRNFQREPNETLQSCMQRYGDLITKTEKIHPAHTRETRRELVLHQTLLRICSPGALLKIRDRQSDAGEDGGTLSYSQLLHKAINVENDLDEIPTVAIKLNMDMSALLAITSDELPIRKIATPRPASPGRSLPINRPITPPYIQKHDDKLKTLVNKIDDLSKNKYPMSKMPGTQDPAATTTTTSTAQPYRAQHTFPPRTQLPKDTSTPSQANVIYNNAPNIGLRPTNRQMDNRGSRNRPYISTNRGRGYSPNYRGQRPRGRGRGNYNSSQEQNREYNSAKRPRYNYQDLPVAPRTSYPSQNITQQKQQTQQEQQRQPTQAYVPPTLPDQSQFLLPETTNVKPYIPTNLQKQAQGPQTSQNIQPQRQTNYQQRPNWYGQNQQSRTTENRGYWNNYTPGERNWNTTGWRSPSPNRGSYGYNMRGRGRYQSNRGQGYQFNRRDQQYQTQQYQGQYQRRYGYNNYRPQTIILCAKCGIHQQQHDDLHCQFEPQEDQGQQLEIYQEEENMCQFDNPQ